MGFQATEASSGEKKVYPSLRGGESGSWSLPARISLIVDLGTQSRPDFQEEYDETKEKHTKALARDNNPATLETVDGKEMINLPQAPVRQVVFFADLVTEMMDYGEDIGEKPYRIMLNKSFMGEIQGTPLTIGQARDNNGKVIKDSPKTFNSRSLVAKLGKACGVNFVKNGNDIRPLAGKAFAATVENTVKGDACYTNFKSASPMMEGIEVPPLAEDCMLITFEDATADQMKFLWKNVRAAIKTSSDFEGSQIQKAMKEADEAFANGGEDKKSETPEEGVDDNEPPF